MIQIHICIEQVTNSTIHPKPPALSHVCGVALFLEQRPNTKTPLNERRWRIPVRNNDERRQNILNPVHPLQVEK
jgi:hypothetical protein